MFIETTRLYLRPFCFNDLIFFTKLLQDPEVMQFSLRGKPLCDQEVEDLFISILDNQEKYGFGAYSIILKKREEWIGFCGLWRKKEKRKEIIDFGYRFFKKYWGKGYASEAIYHISNYLRKLFPRDTIYVFIDRQNYPSKRIAEKCNMKYLGKSTYYGLKTIKYKL